MLITAYIVVLLVWLPPLVTALYNLAWDLKLWQAKDYRIERIYHYLKWDFEPSHRRPLFTLAKIILFLVTGAFAISVDNVWTPLAMLLAFSLWVNEAYVILEHFIHGKFPRLEFNKRNLLIIGLALFGYIVLIVALSASVLTTNPNNTYAFGELLPSTDASGVIFIPAVYVYLVFSTLLAFAFDLSSPIITLLLVVITSPIQWLYTQILVRRAHQKISDMSELMVIGITGSKGKTTVKKLLSDILSGHFPVVATGAGQTSTLSLAKTVINEVTSQTKVLIVEMNAFKQKDILNLTKLARPHLSIITGIDENHVGLFGSVNDLLKAKSELIENMRSGGTVILNSDDELSMDLAKRHDGKEIFFGLKKPEAQYRENNLLEVDHYYADNMEKHTESQTITAVLHNQAHEFEIMLPAAASKVMHSVLAAVAASSEIGMPIPDIITNIQLSSINDYADIETLEGDNHTTLIVDTDPVSINKLRLNLQQLSDLPVSRRILVLSGINELGKYKHETYQTIVKYIRKHANILITYDPKLLKLAHKDNTTLQIIAARDLRDLEYKIRRTMQPSDGILLMGEFDDSLIYSLSSE